MSTVELVTENIWFELSKAVKESKFKSYVAVAYFGQNAANMLPLLKGSTLIIDASIKALKSGQTCPDELLKLYYKGVHIYSLNNLHSKLYVIGNTLYCGSANVSGNSAKFLHETILKTSDKKAIEDAKVFINNHCRIELGEDEINNMKKFYNPPENNGAKRVEKNVNIDFYICNLKTIEYSEDEEKEAIKGRQVAQKNRVRKSRHRIDEFIWSKEIKFKKGDNILQIVTEESKCYVSPIGRLIHIRKWSNGKKIQYFCFVEVPDKRRKSMQIVKKQLSEPDAKSIQRGGKKSLELETNIKSLWK